jgi:hypothetical protein
VELHGDGTPVASSPQGTSEGTIEQRVQAGIDLLNEYKPNWRGLVDVTTLDQQRPSRCILGQVFNGFIKGLNKLEINYTNAQGMERGADFGFCTYDDDHDVPYEDTYEALTKEWAKRIKGIDVVA